MASKSKEREFRERRQIRWYQWEFLRRNAEYKRDHREFMAEFGAWFSKRGFWYQLQRGEVTYSLRDMLFYYNTICPALRAICGKWCITDPFPPDWTFDERGYHRYSPRRLVALPTGYTSEHAALLWNTGPVEAVKGSRGSAFVEQFRTKRRNRPKPQENRHDPHSQYVWLKIDLNRPQTELLGEIANAIKLHKDRLSRAALQPTHTRGRRRLDQYSTYLQVWDLRQKGQTFRDVARLIYPKEYSGSPTPRNPIVQRVMDHFRRAERLIEGGYKDLA